jgi:hypothetical protein
MQLTRSALVREPRPSQLISVLSGHSPVRELISESDMLADETGYWTRMPIAAAIFWGGSMFLAAPLLTPYPVWSSLRRVLFIAATTFGGGVLFAVLFAGFMRLLVSRNARHAYRGSGKWSAPPPAGLALEHRVPASLLVSPRKLVVGSLYLGPSGCSFVPNGANKPPVPPRITIPLRVAAPRESQMQVTGVARLLLSRAPLLLELGPTPETIRLLLPRPSHTIPRIREVLSGYGV